MTTPRYSTESTVRPIVPLSYNDPVAQTFIVENASILTKVDLFFASKDTVLPVNIDIRRVSEGRPSDIIIPYSEVSLRAANINVSSNSLIATTVNFSSPLYVDAGEYAICIASDSSNVKIWVSQVGEVDISNKTVIQKQYDLGVFYKSKNSTVWIPEPLQDLKFNLYRAKFITGQTATIDLTPSDYTSTIVRLPYDPLEVYPQSSTMKVYHPNNGFRDGSYTVIIGLEVPLTLPNIEYYGINHANISGVPLIVSNVTNDSYTVSLPTAVDANVKTITRFGEELIAASDFRFTDIFVSTSVTETPDSVVRHSIKTTNTDYFEDTSFTPITYDKDFNFNEIRTLPSSTNRFLLMNNTAALVHRIEMYTDNPYVAPIIDLDKTGIVLINNKINNPSYETEHKVPAEIRTITTGNTTSFVNLSTTTGQINLSNLNARANAVGMIKGTTIRITGSNNTGNVRVLDVLNSGANILVFGNIVDENNTHPDANIVLYNGTKFIAEEAASGGSSSAKYITRQLNFINPSTAFKFYIDVAKPKDTFVKFYYRISLVGDTSTLTDKEYVEITNIVIKNSLNNEFYEIEKLVDNLPSFDGIQFKIVFLSDNISKIPKCRNLRLVAVA